MKLFGVDKKMEIIDRFIEGQLNEVLESLKNFVSSRKVMLLAAVMPMVSSCEGSEFVNSNFSVDPFVDVTSDVRYSIPGNPNLSVTKVMNFGVVSERNFVSLNLVGQNGKVVYSLPLKDVNEGCEIQGKSCKVAKFDLDQEFGGSVCEIPNGENSCVVISGNSYKVELVGENGVVMKPVSGVVEYSPEKSVVDLSKKNGVIEEAEIVEVSNK